MLKKFSFRLALGSSYTEFVRSDSFEPKRTRSKLIRSLVLGLVASFGEVKVVFILLLLRLTKSPSYLESALEVLGVSGRDLNQAISKSFPVASFIPFKFSETAS